MKILSTIAGWLQGSGIDSKTTPWCRDPLFHPDLRAMSLRELADLPLSAPCVYASAHRAAARFTPPASPA